MTGDGSMGKFATAAVSRWLAPAGLFILSFGLHYKTLQGTFIWDDRPAVLENRDVWTNTPWSDLWRHDFWGQRISHPGSHKSFRPLTTLSFRLNNIAARSLARKSDKPVSTGGAKGGSNRDRVGPDGADAGGFHFVNVIVHASTCAMSAVFLRRIFKGEEIPALMASLLFTVHPVHVEAVAPIVGRADLLCGFFSIAALCTIVRGGVRSAHQERKPSGARRCRGSTGGAAAAGANSVREPETMQCARPRFDEGRALAVDVADPGPRALALALMFAAAATLCKEVGVTVLGLIAGEEAMRCLDRRQLRALVLGESGAVGTVRDVWLRFGHTRAVVRSILPAVCAISLVVLHVRLHEGQAVRKWGILENDIAILPTRKERALSYAHVHAVYVAKLVWPKRLCYDWGFRCIKHVTSLRDLANLASAAVYTGTASATALAVARFDTTVLWGLALLVVPFMPASNVFFPIGAVLAERLLYLPSLGACVLAACTVRRGYDIGDSSGRLARVMIASRDCTERTPVSETRTNCDRGAISDTSLSSAQAPVQSRDKSLSGSQIPANVTAPLSRSGALSSARRGTRGSHSTGSQPISEERTRPRGTAAGSGSSATAYGAPHTKEGIKTLNNLGAGMLNEAEAARGEALLQTAVELHPLFASAWFNLGVARMLQGKRLGAASALQRQLMIEPRSSKTMVHLGRVYLTLAKDASGRAVAPSERARSRDTEDDDIAIALSHGTPESLFSTAEQYTDQALALGTELPLARQVKGEVLLARGDFRTAAGYFREGIDLSLVLLDATSAQGARRDIGAPDALDLAPAYNNLGLAMRATGTDTVAAKDVFVEGLSFAPDDLALLVNGGAAHQAAGDATGAKALYHRALSLHPTSPELLSNLGWLEEETGRGTRASLESAMVLYERALAALGDDAASRSQIETNIRNAWNRLRVLEGTTRHHQE